MSLRDWFWIVLLGAIWGCSFLFNALLIREIGPLWVSAGRVSVGALGCWAFCLVTRRPISNLWPLAGPLLVLGVVGYTMPFALFPLSEEHLPSGIVAIVNALTPMTTVIVSQFWPGGEKATLLKSVGVAIGFVGATVLALPSLAAGGSADAWAIAACLLATLCYALTLNYARRFKGIDPAVLAASALTAAAIASVPAAFATEGVPVLTRPESVLALLGIGLASTTFAFILMYRLLPRIGPTNFSVTTFIAPVSAVILGIALLHEVIEPSEAVGVVLIFAGLVVMDGRLVRRLRRRKFEVA
jgi:drug/metabolite transporter (DMT)-like permease